MGILPTDGDDRTPRRDPATAKASIKELTEKKVFGDKIVTQVVEAGTFWPAEKYHQQYFANRALGETCHTGVVEVHTALAAEGKKAREAAATQAAR